MKIRSKKLGVMLATAVVAGMTSFANAQGGPGGPGGFGAIIGQLGQGRGNAGGNQGLRTAAINASYDARTNTVVITGPTDVLDDIEKVVKEIDNNPSANSQVYTYRLKNASALNVEAVANLLFTGTGGNLRGTTTANQLGGTTAGRGGAAGGRGGGIGGRGGGIGGAGGGAALGGIAGGGGRAGGGGVAQFGGVNTGTTTNAAGLEGQVVVVADPVTNGLLVTTNPKNWDRVKLILDELDRAIPQVLIKVLIAEVTHSNTADLGVEFSVLNTYPLSVLGTGGTFSTITAGQRGGTNFGIPALTGQGAVATITEANFRGVLYALATQNKLDVLSRPYILASDNQLATINVGQTVPYIQSSQTTDTGTTNSVVGYQDIGITLQVVPHINPDGLVILDVAPRIDALTESTVRISETVAAPIYTTRSALTRVAIQSGQTAVIGGLMQDQKTQTVSKVPLLGDIPVMGALFRRTIDGKSKTELLIFLTPLVASRPDMLGGMAKDEVDASKLTPNAVSPNAFDEHLKGMTVGERPIPSATQPATTMPAAQVQQPPLQGRGGFGARGFGSGPGGGRGGRDGGRGGE